jgi:DNA-binding CsgD family transcriptional regulator
MEKTTKSIEIKKMLTENKSTKEISLSLNVSSAYIYKIKKDLNKVV